MTEEGRYTYIVTSAGNFATAQFSMEDVENVVGKQKILVLDTTKALLISVDRLNRVVPMPADVAFGAKLLYISYHSVLAWHGVSAAKQKELDDVLMASRSDVQLVSPDALDENGNPKGSIIVPG